jgi:hypothetical protein
MPWVPQVQSRGSLQGSKSISRETLRVSPSLSKNRVGYQHSSLATSFLEMGSKRESSNALKVNFK